MKLSLHKTSASLLMLAGCMSINQVTMPLPLASDSPYQHKEIMFSNNTDVRVEIGYYYKESRNSPSRFQSSGSVPAKGAAKMVVRITGPMAARTPETNTQFTVSTEDKWLKISGDSRRLVVKEVMPEA